MVSQWRQTLSYPPFGVPVADCYVECEDDEHAEEDGPFDDDAGLEVWDVLVSSIIIKGV